ncbi:hypothetical protein GCM10010199_71010 [Dactylosporangium roseum]
MLITLTAVGFGGDADRSARLLTDDADEGHPFGQRRRPVDGRQVSARDRLGVGLAGRAGATRLGVGVPYVGEEPAEQVTDAVAVGVYHRDPAAVHEFVEVGRHD